eukprot:CAMPEP_0197177922 /NCGR_PEP_ID=MMETSP1423-20130617/3355_1 /TAXON_ID=476441 /ORGANISM="Pseudo-nitzschia heimii, Strain UNC1101" /LENGTH=668 /DNA_ID=CAMNT_0042627547 /DNA_START=49 /DNA_END=2052 /DNA_ORIENTATION=+
MRLANYFRDALVVVAAFIHVVIVPSRVKGESNFRYQRTNYNNLQSSGLYWNNLSVRSMDGTFLLRDFSGFVKDGLVCGILGPSGSGKSTTLSVLGGEILPSSRLQVNGEVFHYDEDTQKKESLRVQGGHVAWMQQEDNFFDMLSVQEILQLAAFLELPEHLDNHRRQRVISVMESLGLGNLKNRKVGNSASFNCLSGGEKRRLSLALELISEPKLFLADELSSGLDSTMSKKVLGLVKKMICLRSIPCIVSLHQPQSSMFKMLDYLILMGPGGYICYHGEAAEAVSYFERLGFPCPKQTNPAEFLIDLVSVDSEDALQATEDELRVVQLATAFAKRQKSYGKNFTDFRVATSATDAMYLKDVANPPHRTRTRQSLSLRRLGSLLLRSWRQNIRDHRVNLFRLFASVGNAVLFTRIFHSIKKGIFNAKSVADRVALLSFSVINMSMMTLMKTINLFAKEKPVVHREQQRLQYSSAEYLLAKTIAEIPMDTIFAVIFTSALKFSCGIRIGLRALIGVFTLMTVAGSSLGFAIGALSPSGDTAVIAGIPIMVVMMTVGIINPAGIDQSEPQPLLVGILKQLSPISFAIKALCLAEYRGMEFEDLRRKEKRRFVDILSSSRNVLKELPKMGALALVQNGDQVLVELGLEKDNYKTEMKNLAILSIGNLLLSW